MRPDASSVWMLLSMKSFKIMLQGGIVVVDEGRRLTIAVACRGSLDGELAMPASSHSLRLTAIAPEPAAA